MKRKMGGKKLLMTFVFVMVSCLITSNAVAGWYYSTVTNVTPKNDGNVVLRIISAGATPFPGGNANGEARVQINEADPGGSKMLATVLTAVSLNLNVSIEVLNSPSWGTIQDITGVSVLTQ
jgi:hypothetical protein